MPALLLCARIPTMQRRYFRHLAHGGFCPSNANCDDSAVRWKLHLVAHRAIGVLRRSVDALGLVRYLSRLIRCIICFLRSGSPHIRRRAFTLLLDCGANART